MIKDQEYIMEMNDHITVVNIVRFSPCGRMLATASERQIVIYVGKSSSAQTDYELWLYLCLNVALNSSVHHTPYISYTILIHIHIISFPSPTHSPTFPPPFPSLLAISLVQPNGILPPGQDPLDRCHARGV
ncbi:hypothetical protein EON65_13745 [archaeon]|nr:MAG: hypothetical protein EON65_13745 [archaeon]